MAAKPLPPPRQKYHAERIREVFNQIDKTGDGKLSFMEIKHGVDEQDIDWKVCGLDGDKIKKSIFKKADSDGDKMVDFDEFWAFALEHGQGHSNDPVLQAHAYLTEHKIIAMMEAMTAAVMVAKPDAPKPFLVEKLKELKATGTPVMDFSEEDLVTMFTMFDPTGVGKISAAQCNKALEVLTGHEGGVAKEGNAVYDPKEPVATEEFVGHAQGALKQWCS